GPHRRGRGMDPRGQRPLSDGDARGAYTHAHRDQPDAPAFTYEELAAIGSALDFVGINVYRPTVYVESDDDSGGPRVVPINASHPKMKSGWHILDPEVLYWAPRQVQSLWDAQSIYITENGCAAEDVVAEDGRVPTRI